MQSQPSARSGPREEPEAPTDASTESRPAVPGPPVKVLAPASVSLEDEAPLDGRRFKVLRVARGLSVEDVATLAGFLFVDTLAEWEQKGHDPNREPTIGRLVALARVLHVDVLAMIGHLLGDPTIDATSVLDSAPRPHGKRGGR